MSMSVAGFLRGALRERARLLDQVERAMRGFVGHADDVVEARARIRNLVLGDIRQLRLDAEALERFLQVAGELAQLAEHPRLAHVHDVVDGREEGLLVLGAQRIGERLDAGAVFQFQYLQTRHVDLTYPGPGSCRAFLSAFPP